MLLLRVVGPSNLAVLSVPCGYHISTAAGTNGGMECSLFHKQVTVVYVWSRTLQSAEAVVSPPQNLMCAPAGVRGSDK